jgi:flagellar protein FlbD
MIVLTRLNGTRYAINDEQIERIEDGGNTVVVLVNGNRYTALESLDEVVDAIVEFRARVLDVATIGAGGSPSRRLSVLHSEASTTLFRPHSVLSEDTGSVDVPEEPLIDKRRPKLRDALRPKRED